MANDIHPPGHLASNSPKDPLETKIDPQKMFSKHLLKKKRSSFWICLIAAFLLMILALGAAVYYTANKVDIFENALIQNVDGTLGLDELSLRSFARETIFYLNGSKEDWEPQIVVNGIAAGQLIISPFRTHMATVKGWFSSATTTLLAGAAVTLALLCRALVGRKGSKKSSFSLGGYYLGALISLMIIGGTGLWGTLHFNSLWTLLHKTLIPDGIFDIITAPIMHLFPVGLFAAYLQPAAAAFGLLAAVVLALPLILAPLSKPLTNMFGSSGNSPRTTPRSGGKAARTKSNQPAPPRGSATGKAAAHRASGVSTAKKTNGK